MLISEHLFLLSNHDTSNALLLYLCGECVTEAHCLRIMEPFLWKRSATGNILGMKVEKPTDVVLKERKLVIQFQTFKANSMYLCDLESVYLLY